MKFLLPTEVPQFDFQFQVLASQDYWTNFKNNPLEIAYADKMLSFHDYSSYCPVGSIEFCQKHGIKTLPRNIPPQLKQYAVGHVTSKKFELDLSKLWHVKSSKVIKHSKNGVWSLLYRENFPFEDEEFQAVEWLNEGFISEWRVFVLDGNIIDMQNYAGDIWTLPSKETILHMIYDFEHAKGSNVPPAYTLDVGVVSCKSLNTKVIEVHDFYACGTYNLNDHYHYPIMLWEWWNWYRRNVKS